MWGPDCKHSHTQKQEERFGKQSNVLKVAVSAFRLFFPISSLGICPFCGSRVIAYQTCTRIDSTSESEEIGGDLTSLILCLKALGPLQLV